MLRGTRVPDELTASRVAGEGNRAVPDLRFPARAELQASYQADRIVGPDGVNQPPFHRLGHRPGFPLDHL